MASCVLAVDTATEICGVALAVDGVVTTELVLNNKVTHTRSVMAAVDTVLSMAVVDLGDIDGFAVTRGPGGFTGLRIGISTVKGLCLATDKPLVGVSSLEVLAHQAPVDTGLICPMIDARRSELYWALYEKEGDLLRPVAQEQVGPVAALAEAIDQPCCFVGNGVGAYRSPIEKHLNRPARWADAACNGIRPMVLVQLAWRRFCEKKTADIKSFTPVYLRKSDAELNRKR